MHCECVKLKIDKEEREGKLTFKIVIFFLHRNKYVASRVEVGELIRQIMTKFQWNFDKIANKGNGEQQRTTAAAVFIDKNETLGHIIPKKKQYLYKYTHHADHLEWGIKSLI